MGKGDDGSSVTVLVLVLLASAISYWCFMRRPCAGQHLLFFAAAKKSRQKKAAEHRQFL
jgi:hypothetical protein